MSPRMRLLIPTATAALALALVQACTTRNVTEVDVGSVEVQPAAPTVAEGATVQLNATVRDDHGAPIPQAVVAWSSDDDGIATVDDNGRATGTGAGTTTIRASFQGVVGTATITVEPGPSIHAIPDSVSLFGSQGSSPTPVVIQIENGGVGTLSGLQATVAYEGSANGWLPVSLAGTTAPTTLSLTAVTAGLAVGDYRAVVAVTGNAGNSPLEIPVRLSVTEDAPIISLAPSSLTIEGVSGRAPPGPVLVQVTNAGGGSLSGLSPSVWYSGSTAGWLSASIASPTAPTQLSVTANASSLPPGTYRGEVRVAAPVAVNNPEPLPVTFNVAPAPESADVSVTTSGPTTAQSGQRIGYTVTVRNDGPDPAATVVVRNTIPTGTSFVSASAGTFSSGVLTWNVGTLQPNTSQIITVTVDIGGSTTGTLVNSVTVTTTTTDPNSGNNSASAVTTVGAAPAPAVVVLDSALVSFSANAGGGSGEKTVGVTNGGGGTLSQLSRQVVYTTGSGWLNSSLAATTAPTTLQMIASAAELGAGTYNALVIVSSAVAGVKPDTVAVTFQVNPPAQNQAPTAAITAPTDGASFTQGQTVDFTGSGSDPEDGTLSGGSLVWESDKDGQIGTGTSFSTDALTVETHAITLTATDSGNLTGTDQVTITINPPANQAPTAAITAPTDGASFTQGQTVDFTGSGSDPEDGTLSGASLVWESDKDGQIGTGTSFSTDALTVETHTITLTVTDSGNLTGTDQITITVTPPPTVSLDPSSVTFTAPLGGTEKPQQLVSVTNAGGGTLKQLKRSIVYKVGSNWLVAELSNKSAPATLTLTADPKAKDLAEGEYTADVIVFSDVAIAIPDTVAVTFNITQPAIGLGTTSVGFTVLDAAAPSPRPAEPLPAATDVDPRPANVTDPPPPARTGS